MIDGAYIVHPTGFPTSKGVDVISLDRFSHSVGRQCFASVIDHLRVSTASNDLAVRTAFGHRAASVTPRPAAFSPASLPRSSSCPVSWPTRMNRGPRRPNGLHHPPG